ncbi:MetQ/NlpA family ABC transporter substrate-binding protein [Defluviitalea phaphyphila]|uniref:MetQ/NlpA family ABC transporter substrate-binding protein n=1 Tax=Defluviitalea phaphyphila TaxID=1473580 RepID=UPI000730EE0B|nr:MetQ/NlpA family ABC transporter substrate-binding protein [Defluviitalea phaphyphila]
MNKKIIAILTLAILTIGILGGCSKESNEAEENTVLKVSATSVPHAQMLEYIKDDLKEQGIELDIMVIDEYNTHNRALQEKEVDANFFQHIPFLEKQIAEFGYDLEVLAKVHIEPLGVYSEKVTSLDELEEGAVIAIPNDTSNEARALALLHNNGLIELNDVNDQTATILDIKNNPKGLVFQEMEAAALPMILQDVDAAVINTNFAIKAELSPTEDALAIEDANSPYVNVLVIRKGEADREDLKALAEALTSDKMKKYIEDNYNGEIVPVF